MKEAKLIELAQSGDRGALNKLFKYYYPLALYRASYFIKDKEVSQDATQNAMIRAWSKLHLYNGAAGSFRSWLMTIVQHACFDHLNKQLWRNKIIKMKSLDEFCENLEVEADSRWLIDYNYAPETFLDEIAVIIEMESISPLDRSIMGLRAENYGHDEIAKMLHITPNVSKKHLQKTRSILRERIFNNV